MSIRKSHRTLLQLLIWYLFALRQRITSPIKETRFVLPHFLLVGLGVLTLCHCILSDSPGTRGSEHVLGLKRDFRLSNADGIF